MTPGPGSTGLGEGAKRGDLNEEKPLGRWRLKGWEVWRVSGRVESLQLTWGARPHTPRLLPSSGLFSACGAQISLEMLAKPAEGRGWLEVPSACSPPALQRRLYFIIQHSINLYFRELEEYSVGRK